MTSFEIHETGFSKDRVAAFATQDARFKNWPVVYTLDGRGEVYVGESLNVAGRFRQHLDNAVKQRLSAARVVLDPTFNKSVCLDLESFLIRLFAGDGKYQVINGNEGITDADYYGRAGYRETFEEIFEELRSRGAFTRSIRQIENLDLFKLSPFKALNPDQAVAVEDILRGLFDDLETGRQSRIVIQGGPGTGKTVVGIYLMKLLVDIMAAEGLADADVLEGESVLSEFFLPGYPELLRGFRIGLVVPQQSLRRSIQKVFKRTPGLHPSMVLTPFQVGQQDQPFDLLIVDEAHRLNQRANQASGPQNAAFGTISTKLFGIDDLEKTQVDWIVQQSRHQIFLLDEAQAVRPADISLPTVQALLESSRSAERWYPLTTQMRVHAGDDFVKYVRDVLSPQPPQPQGFDGYDLRFFDDVSTMVGEIRARDDEYGLARILAGYAWPWVSKKDPHAFDIRIGDTALRWNGAVVDWVNSEGSLEEVGSIHTVQGYDLNYAGVIIGPDLRYDVRTGRLSFSRDDYHDAKGKENNPARRISYDDDALLTFVRNIYGVLLTRGMSGTYVYVCDPDLREYLRPFFSVAP